MCRASSNRPVESRVEFLLNSRPAGERLLSLTSLRVSYTLPASVLRGRNLSMLKFSVTGNEIFYCSTIKQERGLNYPYARSINFSAYINF